MMNKIISAKFLIADLDYPSDLNSFKFAFQNRNSEPKDSRILIKSEIIIISFCRNTWRVGLYPLSDVAATSSTIKVEQAKS